MRKRSLADVSSSAPVLRRSKQAKGHALGARAVPADGVTARMRRRVRPGGTVIIFFSFDKKNDLMPGN